MWLEAASGRSAISKQAPVPLIAECALLRRMRTTELAGHSESEQKHLRLESLTYTARRFLRVDLVGWQSAIGGQGTTDDGIARTLPKRAR